MDFTALYERLQSELFLHGAQYKFYIEAATVAVLFYVALTDFLTFKIRNEVVLLFAIRSDDGRYIGDRYIRSAALVLYAGCRRRRRR
jgi:hypothetical protein